MYTVSFNLMYELCMSIYKRSHQFKKMSKVHKCPTMTIKVVIDLQFSQLNIIENNYTYIYIYLFLLAHTCCKSFYIQKSI